MNQQGYHMCVNRKLRHVTIHAPTDQWEHLPRPDSKTCFWIGPFPTLYEAQDVAQDGAEYSDYDVRLCRRCFGSFHRPTAQPRRRGGGPRGWKDWLPKVGKRPSRGGIANSRRK